MRGCAYVARMRFVFPLWLVGCVAASQSGAARAQEAAAELNLNARFGRMELASEYVAPKARELFFERRKLWGGRVRVADYEITGMKMRGDEAAEVVMHVAWYRIDEGDLKSTTIRQGFHAIHGEWKLVEESRVDGELGLLGEAVLTVPRPSGPPAPPARFPTIRLGAESTEAREGE